MKKVITTLLLTLAAALSWGQIAFTDNGDAIGVTGGGITLNFSKSGLLIFTQNNNLMFTAGGHTYRYPFADIDTPAYSTLDSVYTEVAGWLSGTYVFTGGITADTIIADYIDADTVKADYILADTVGYLAVDTLDAQYLISDTITDGTATLIGGELDVTDITVNTPVNIYGLSHNSFADYVAEQHYFQTAIDSVNTSLTGLLYATSGVLSALDTATLIPTATTIADMVNWGDTTAVSGVGIATAYDIASFSGSNWTVTGDTIEPNTATLIYTTGDVYGDTAKFLHYGGHSPFTIGMESGDTSMMAEYTNSILSGQWYNNYKVLLEDTIASLSLQYLPSSYEGGYTAQILMNVEGVHSSDLRVTDRNITIETDSLDIQSTNITATGDLTLTGDIYADSAKFLHYGGHSPFSIGDSSVITFDAAYGGNLVMDLDGFNIGLGSGVLANNTVIFDEGGLDAGYWNVAVGDSALYSNTTGKENSAFGNESLYANTTGNGNSAFGSEALYSNTDGFSNSAFGAGALYSNTEGYVNSAFGSEALYANTTGIGNSAFGGQALYSNTTGGHNVAIGSYAGYSNTTDSANIFIGDSAGYNATASNQLWIDNSSTTTPLIWGDFLADSLVVHGYLTLNRMVVVPQSTAPSDPAEGTIYYDTEDHMLYFWNGSAWKAMNYTP